MTTFVALLRGVNVSGQKPIRMDALTDSCAAIGLTDVRTYLQSGNVVFSAPAAQAKKLAGSIRARIKKDFGHDVDVQVLSAKEITRIATSNPLQPKTGEDEKTYHVTFLAAPVSNTRFKALKLPAQTGERAVLDGDCVYLHCPHGYGKSKLTNAYFEKALAVAATTRNWRTVLALTDMCAE